MASRDVRFPPFVVVRQRFPQRGLRDVAGEVRRQLSLSGLARGLKRGSTVAIGVGSRGIANLDVIVQSMVSWWAEQGMKPFLFPAMGSHGAASARGQAEVLARYGITEAAMGCPVRSSLAVAGLGRTGEGIEVVMDRTAHAAGAVMLCARVKWHTDFSGKLESGLFKMMAIGLGKWAGAQRYHAHAHTMGLEAVIRSVGRQVLKSGRILGGLAILEDENHQTAHLEVIPAESLERREEELLEMVKGWMPRIPLPAVDLLIVNEIGKNLSGSGMDPKVINRTIHGQYNPWPFAPRVSRVFVRDVHAMSHGNAIGLGMADVVHSRVVQKMKKRPTWINGLTSGALACIRTPVHFKSDRECLEKIRLTTGRLEASELRMGWIRNTQDLSVLACTANLRDQLARNESLEVGETERELEFDGRGDLLNLIG
ncbi:MAG: hypothetical protein HY858_00945 [Candidatus Solibacter usitatus]|nr:hypothetical protein [Candidatus Solibacter usitatus]